MGKVNRLPNIRAIVDENGLLTPESRITLDELFERIPITGRGSPEGVVEARAGTGYYDLDGTTGSIHYVKMTESGTTGWTLA